MGQVAVLVPLLPEDLAGQSTSRSLLPTSPDDSRGHAILAAVLEAEEDAFSAAEVDSPSRSTASQAHHHPDQQGRDTASSRLYAAAAAAAAAVAALLPASKAPARASSCFDQVERTETYRGLARRNRHGHDNPAAARDNYLVREAFAGDEQIHDPSWDHAEQTPAARERLFPAPTANDAEQARDQDDVADPADCNDHSRHRTARAGARHTAAEAFAVRHGHEEEPTVAEDRGAEAPRRRDSSYRRARAKKSFRMDVARVKGACSKGYRVVRVRRGPQRADMEDISDAWLSSVDGLRWETRMTDG